MTDLSFGFFDIKCSKARNDSSSMPLKRNTNVLKGFQSAGPNISHTRCPLQTDAATSQAHLQPFFFLLFSPAGLRGILIFVCEGLGSADNSSYRRSENVLCHPENYSRNERAENDFAPRLPQDIQQSQPVHSIRIRSIHCILHFYDEIQTAMSHKDERIYK